MWIEGRIEFIEKDIVNIDVDVEIERMFMNLMMLIEEREIIEGNKWRNMKVMGGIEGVMIENLDLNYMVIKDGDVKFEKSIGVSEYVIMVKMIGGRIIKRFKRKWMKRMGKKRFKVKLKR